MPFRKKRADTKASTIEQIYGVSFPYRRDAHLKTLLKRTGASSLTQLVREQRAREATLEAACRSAVQEEYLTTLLHRQTPRAELLRKLRGHRQEIERIVNPGWGEPVRVYYAGSYAKGTLTTCAYDLDVVVYVPPSSRYTVEDAYTEIEERLRRAGYNTRRHNVAIRLPLGRAFHVDVVPGKVLTTDNQLANLYASELGTTRLTDVRHHVALVLRSRHRDVIRLLKIWKNRQRLDLSTFVLELTVAEALAGSTAQGLGWRAMTVLRYLSREFRRARLVDPANANNVVSNDVTAATKMSVQRAAERALAQSQWKLVVGE